MSRTQSCSHGTRSSGQNVLSLISPNVFMKDCMSLISNISRTIVVLDSFAPIVKCSSCYLPDHLFASLRLDDTAVVYR